MNNPIQKSIITSLIIVGVLFSCSKKESIGETTVLEKEFSENKVNNNISTVAKQNVKGKDFVKSAQVQMQVKEVYAATIAIEKQLKKIGGYVTKSELSSELVSEETYSVSDKEAKLVKKFKQVNLLEVKVPTIHLAEFLENVHHHNVFLQSRNISAEDVSANIAFAKEEEKRLQKNTINIDQLKTDNTKVDINNQNEKEKNLQKLETYLLADNLKYSSVSILLTEPSERISVISIPNTSSIENEFKISFWFDLKNALVRGFYLIQYLVIGLFTIWPILLLSVLLIFLWKKNKKRKQN